MFRVLIADDEVRLCRLIKKLIHWDDLDVELIDFVHNGDDLLQMIIDEKPDIVISDIRMPGLSGLEVVQKCRESSDLPKFIMLTGYSEFEYAYTAIKNGVEDFLLKPVNGAELNAAIAKLTESLIQRKYADSYVNSQGIASDYILDMFSGNYGKHDPTVLDAMLNGRTLLPCLFCIDMKPDMGYYIDAVSNHIIKALRNNFAMSSYELYLANRSDGICVLIGDTTSDMGKKLYLLERTLDEIRNNTISGGIVDITVCIGLPIADNSNISVSMQNVRYSENARLCLGRNRLIDSNSIVWKDSYSFPKIESGEIIRAMNSQDSKTFKAIISALMIKHKPTDDQAHNSILYCQLFISYIKRIVENQFAIANIAEESYRRLFDAIPACSSIDTAAEEIASCFAEQIDTIFRQNSKADSLVIQSVKEYISDHYGEAITLADLGNVVYMSPSYLGTLFKQKTGMAFSTYLTQVRVDKAKSLLLNSHYTVAEIAHITGYQDVRHFSKIFLQNVGIRPTEYRKYHYRPNNSEEQ